MVGLTFVRPKHNRYTRHCVILLRHSCGSPFSCYFTTIMLCTTVTRLHSCLLTLRLSYSFATLRPFPLSYCFATVIFLATVMILWQSCCSSAFVIPLCQSCCLPSSCYIVNMTILAIVMQLCHCHQSLLLSCSTVKLMLLSHSHTAWPLSCYFATVMLLCHCVLLCWSCCKPLPCYLANVMLLDTVTILC